MNRILLLSGSPKYKDSASSNYLDMLASKLDDNYYIEEDNMIINNHLIDKINKADILVIASPLYADSLPSHVINFLIKISDLNLSNKLVYVIMNCGFLEGIHNIVALDIIKNYCDCYGLRYMGGLGIGGGPIGYQKALYNYSIKEKINRLARYINYQNDYQNQFTSPLIPRMIYIWIANYRWKRAINSFKS